MSMSRFSNANKNNVNKIDVRSREKQNGDRYLIEQICYADLTRSPTDFNIYFRQQKHFLILLVKKT